VSNLTACLESNICRATGDHPVESLGCSP
jgi:hypothetical protein